MNHFESVDQVFEFAIAREEEAARFYTDLAARMEQPAMREVFAQFAEEEQGHKRKLVAMREGKLQLPATEKVRDLKLADYLVDDPLPANPSYKEALILAMKREKASFRLYTDLAARSPDSVRATFQVLAQEEARHKLRFEIEYDREFLGEN